MTTKQFYDDTVTRTENSIAIALDVDDLIKILATELDDRQQLAMLANIQTTVNRIRSMQIEQRKALYTVAHLLTKKAQPN